MRTVWAIIGLVLLVAVVLALGGAAIFFMMPRLGFAMMNGGRLGFFGTRGFGTFGFGLGIIGWLVRGALLALVIIGLVAFASALAWRSGATTMTPVSAVNQTPLDILKTRYARGEITKEQYDQLKRDLEIP